MRTKCRSVTAKLPLAAIVLSVTLFAFTSCSKTDQADHPVQVSEKFVQSTPVPTVEPMPAATPEVIENTEAVSDASGSAEPINTVLLDTGEIYVEFRGIEEYSSDSWIVNLYVENNSDSEFYLSLRNGRINDYLTGFSNNGTSVQANSKYLAVPNFDFIIDLDDLKAYGITTIDTLAFDLYISTSMLGDSISETPVDLEINKIISSEPANGAAIGTGSVLVNSEDVYVEFLGIDEYSSESWIVNLYAENRRDSEVYLSLQDEMINSFSISLANDGITIPAHCKYLAAPNFDLVINTEDLAAYGVSSIETLDFKLNISTSLFGDTISETPVNLKLSP